MTQVVGNEETLKIENNTQSKQTKRGPGQEDSQRLSEEGRNLEKKDSQIKVNVQKYSSLDPQLKDIYQMNEAEMLKELDI